MLEIIVVVIGIPVELSRTVVGEVICMPVVMVSVVEIPVIYSPGLPVVGIITPIPG